MIRDLPLSKSEPKYDKVSLGEIMLRLDSEEGRVRTARSFCARESVGECNVACSLCKCFRQMKPSDVDWEKLFREKNQIVLHHLGAKIEGETGKWFQTSITAIRTLN